MQAASPVVMLSSPASQSSSVSASYAHSPASPARSPVTRAPAFSHSTTFTYSTLSIPSQLLITPLAQPASLAFRPILTRPPSASVASAGQRDRDEVDDELLDEEQSDDAIAITESTDDDAAPTSALSASAASSTSASSTATAAAAGAAGESGTATRPVKSRTLPGRSGMTGRRTAALGGRMALFASQQKQDGLYCLLTVVKRPQWEDEIEAEEDEKPVNAASSNSSSSSSSSSEDDSSDSSTSSPASSSSSAPLSAKQRRARRKARKRQKEAEAARLKRLKQRQNQPSIFTLNKHGATFGKQPDAPLAAAQSPSKGVRRVVLEDGYVSKRHFSVWCERGRWMVMDVGSLNGTFVRRRRRQRETEEADEDGCSSVVDVERCLLSYGYGYENSLRHVHDGYRLTLHRVFVMGNVELMVVAAHDDDSEEQSDRHHVLLQYTQRSAAGSQDSGASVLSARIDTSGATLGTADTCTLPLSDPLLLPHHASITYNDGRFYLIESLPPSSLSPPSATLPSSTISASPPLPLTSCGVWSRLSLKGEESVPHVLCSGDLLRAGFTEVQVDIRAIPPSNAGGYGFGTSGPLPSTLPATSCAYDVGVALDGNFMHTKEMQDRAVAVEGWGGRGGLFVGVFDGHQERVVADYAAASVHHNVLEEVAVLEKERWTQWQQRQRDERQKENGGDKEKPGTALALAVEESVSHSVSVASSTVNDRLYDEESRTSSSNSVEQRGRGRHQRLDSDRSEARIGSAYYEEDDEDEQEDDSFDESERSESQRPPLSISIHSDPLSVSVHSPTSASSNSASQTHKLPASPPLNAAGLSNPHSSSSTCPAASSSFSSTANLPPPIDVSLACQRGYRRTSSQIRGLSDSALYSGSTAVTALLYHHHCPTTAASASAGPFSHTTLTVCNLGDSHAYLFTRTAMVELSYPHTARDVGEQARVKAAGGKITANHRLAGCLEVTRALGDLGLVGFGLSDEVWVKELVLGDEERWLLLCSDGVDVLGVKEIEEVVRDGERDGKAADEISRELVDRAIRRKSRDNISVVVVSLHSHTERQQKLPATTDSMAATDASQLHGVPAILLTGADSSQVMEVTGSGPQLASPRKQLLLSVNRTDAPRLPSSAGLSIVTDSLDSYHSHDHLSSSAPPVDDANDESGSGRLDMDRRRKSVSSGVQSQPVSANERSEEQVDVEMGDGAVLISPSPLSHSVSSPAGSGHLQMDE